MLSETLEQYYSSILKSIETFHSAASPLKDYMLI
jgi:hypothetical protein